MGIRIHEASKKYNLSNKEMADLLLKLGFEGKTNPLAGLPDEMMDVLAKHFAAQKPAKGAAVKAKDEKELPKKPAKADLPKPQPAPPPPPPPVTPPPAVRQPAQEPPSVKPDKKRVESEEEAGDQACSHRRRRRRSRSQQADNYYQNRPEKGRSGT